MDDIPFIETSIARRVFGIINLARRRGENAVIVGEPGVGKTRAFNAYRNAFSDDAVLMTINRFNGSTPRRLFAQLAETLGIWKSGTIADLHSRLLGYPLEHKVLLLDEAQNLSPESIRELLNLEMPVILCGNREVLKSVSHETGPLAQIGDRIGLREEIDCIPSEDADAIANSFGVEGMDAYEITRKLGTRYRARALVRVLKGAREQAGTDKIKAAHIRDTILGFHPQYRSALK